MLVERRGQRFVAKTAALTEASAAWEAALLEFLQKHGLIVPLLLRALSGGFTAGGLILMTYVEGRAPATADDWQAVAGYLERVHQLTRSWPARPDMPTVISLLGTNDELRQGMDAGARLLLRKAWSPIARSPTSVIHGDPNAHNVIVTADGPALIDWEESRVDFSVLDEAGLPGGESIPEAYAAALAWEAFLFWESDTTYAWRCLSRLEGVIN